MSSKQADDYLVFEFTKIYKLWSGEAIKWPTDKQKN